MGISGSVRCTCYEDGLASPPAPVRVDEHDGIHAVDPTDEATVRAWRRTACRHADMDLAKLDLGWRFVRSFRSGLEEMGAARFPVLLETVPDWNGAFWITPAEAAAALAELRAFEAEVGRTAVDRLVVVDGGATMWQTARGEPMWLYSTSPCRAGLTGQGTFALWPEQDFGTPPLFEASSFTQRVLERSSSGFPRTVELTDLDADGTDRVVWDGTLTFDYAETARFEVRSLVLSADELYPAVPQFRAVLEGAVATGHHAEWG